MALDAEQVSRARRLSNSEWDRVGIVFGMFTRIRIGTELSGGEKSLRTISWLCAAPHRKIVASDLDKGNGQPLGDRYGGIENRTDQWRPAAL